MDDSPKTPSSAAAEVSSRWLRVAAATIAAVALAGTGLACAHGNAAAGVSRAGDGAVRVVAVGDIACEPGSPVTPTTCRQVDVGALVERLRPKQLLLTGDVQYNKGTLASYQGSFGPAFSATRPVWRPTPGNHEYATAGAAGYYDFFGARAGPGRRGWYSFNAGRWHFVSLNSNCAVAGCDRSSAQVRWLRADLKRSHSRCTIAYWHHPLASSSLHGGNTAVAPLWHELDRAGAELVLNGHEHSYERFSQLGENGLPKRGGVREIVVGTGGHSMYSFRQTRPGSVARVTGFGALALDLRRDSYAWKLVMTDGSVRDHSAARCR